MIIYKGTNLINGKVRIGQTIRSLKIRVRDYVYGSKNPKNHITFSIFLYGKNNFKWEIIAKADSKKELDTLEKYYINLYKAFLLTNGYNKILSSTGGQWLFSDETILKHKASQRTKEIRKKRSLIQKERMKDPIKRQQQSISMKKLFENKEMRDKWSRAAKNNWKNNWKIMNEGRQKKEYKNKMSVIQKKEWKNNYKKRKETSKKKKHRKFDNEIIFFLKETNKKFTATDLSKIYNCHVENMRLWLKIFTNKNLIKREIKMIRLRIKLFSFLFKEINQ